MFTIVGNPYLTTIDIPITVVYPKIEKIMIVKENPKVPLATIKKLKKICPHCEIDGYFSSEFSRRLLGDP